VDAVLIVAELTELRNFTDLLISVSNYYRGCPITSTFTATEAEPADSIPAVSRLLRKQNRA